MQPALRLYEDVLSNGSEMALAARPRMIFVVHGSVTIADKRLQDGETWSGEGAATLKAGSMGAALWRQCSVSAGWLRLSASSSRSRHPLSARWRHPHRHPWPFDVLRAGRRMV
jgi:hypothetical protein